MKEIFLLKDEESFNKKLEEFATNNYYISSEHLTKFEDFPIPQKMKDSLRSNAIKWIIFKFDEKLGYDVLSENTGFSYKDLEKFSKDFIIHI